MTKQKRCERVTVWLTPEMKKVLARDAKRIGLSLSNYASDLLSGERLIYMAEADHNQLLSTRFHLFRIGSNHDRIAKALERLSKSQEDIDLPQLDWLKEASEELRRSVSKLNYDLYIIRPFRPLE